MSKNRNPEIPRKLIDAMIQTVLERGFGPGIDDITERAGVSKMSAYAQFTSRTGLTVAALEQVGNAVRKNLKAAMNRPDDGGIFGDSSLTRVADCLVEHLTDRDNPIGFITSCLVGHPGQGSRIRAAAVKEHEGITGWLENYFRTVHVMPYPENTANAVMALIHGTFVSMLGGEPAPSSTNIQANLLLRYILLACMKEKTPVPHTPKRRRI